MSAKILSFKTGHVISPHVAISRNHDRFNIKSKPKHQPIIKAPQIAGYTFKTHAPYMYDKILARYGLNPPKGGVIYKERFKPDDLNELYIDSYGRGCIQNIIHNPYKKQLEKQGLWNRPMPFPADLKNVYNALIKHKDSPVHLGLKSEFFPWMDLKYNFSLEILYMLKDLNIKAEIFTCSDLIAHDTYIYLVRDVASKVTVRMPNLNPKTARIEEPGAPSALRRKRAIEKLRDFGVPVSVVDYKYWPKPKDF